MGRNAEKDSCPLALISDPAMDMMVLDRYAGWRLHNQHALYQCEQHIPRRRLRRKQPRKIHKLLGAQLPLWVGSKNTFTRLTSTGCMWLLGHILISSRTPRQTPSHTLWKVSWSTRPNAMPYTNTIRSPQNECTWRWRCAATYNSRSAVTMPPPKRGKTANW